MNKREVSNAYLSCSEYIVTQMPQKINSVFYKDAVLLIVNFDDFVGIVNFTIVITRI